MANGRDLFVRTFLTALQGNMARRQRQEALTERLRMQTQFLGEQAQARREAAKQNRLTELMASGRFTPAEAGTTDPTIEMFGQQFVSPRFQKQQSTEEMQALISALTQGQDISGLNLSTPEGQAAALNVALQNFQNQQTQQQTAVAQGLGAERGAIGGFVPRPDIESENILSQLTGGLGESAFNVAKFFPATAPAARLAEALGIMGDKQKTGPRFIPKISPEEIQVTTTQAGQTVPTPATINNLTRKAREAQSFGALKEFIQRVGETKKLTADQMRNILINAGIDVGGVI